MSPRAEKTEPTPSKIVAIAGYAGSGKDLVATIYGTLCNVAITISLSQLVRDDLTRTGIDARRDLQQFVATYRRETEGGGYWVDRAIALAANKASDLVLTGVYATDEVHRIHRLGGVVIWVEADEKNRLERIARRLDGPRDELILRDPPAFTEQIQSESGSLPRSGAVVSLSGVKGLADHVLVNNGDLSELKRSVGQLFTFVDKHYKKDKGNLVLLATAPAAAYDAAKPWVDSVETLATLEKAHFFETFLGSTDAVITGGLTEIEATTSLRDAVRVLYKPNLRSITGNQIALRVGSIFQQENPHIALKQLRLLKPSNLEEEYFIGLSDAEFFDIHLKAHLLWASDRESLLDTLPRRLEKVQQTDKQQFEGRKDRSLNRMRRDGLVLSIDPGERRRITELASNPLLAVRPILESIKNERIFNVSGFVGSKASVVIHDVIDHLWTFDLLDRIGILHRYGEMFDAIGSPDKTDIFKREGETVASISYGVRAFQGVAPGFRPLIGSKEIVKMVREMRGRLSERHTDALRIINNLESDGTEWRSLAYTFSNYITELDEQRRTYGAIKYKDTSTRRVTRELDPLSPDYLCFFIETHHALLDSANKHRNALFYTHFLIEEYLRSISEDDHISPISLMLDLLDGNRLRYSSSVPKQASEWMFRNYGFTANRNPV